MKKFMKLKYLIALLVIIVYSVVIVIVFNNGLINGTEYDSWTTGYQLLNKENVYKEFYNEHIYCYYSGLISYEDLVDLELFNEEDYEKLANYQKEERKYKKNISFEIGFGEMDGNDCIYLCRRYGGFHFNEVTQFYFKSNLDYSFESIVQGFEELLGTEITNEMLRSKNDGIDIMLEKNGDKVYIYYQMMDSHGNVYIINK